MIYLATKTLKRVYLLATVFVVTPSWAQQQDPFATRPPVNQATENRVSSDQDPLSTTLRTRPNFEFPTNSDPAELLSALANEPEFPWDFIFGSSPLDQFVFGRKGDAVNMIEYGKRHLDTIQKNTRRQKHASATIQPRSLSPRQLFVLGTVSQKLQLRDDALRFFETGILGADDPTSVAAMRDELAGMYGSFVSVSNVPFQKNDTSSAVDAIRIHGLAIADESEQNRANRLRHLLRLVKLHVELDQVDRALDTARILVRVKPDVELDEIFGVPAWAIVLKPDTPMSAFLTHLAHDTQLSGSLRDQARSLLK